MPSPPCAFESPFFESLNNDSLVHSSSSTRTIPICDDSIARIIFSLTPLRFSSIRCSVSSLKLLGRLPMIVMIVFSLKPALTSLTIDAFVSGPSDCCCCPNASIAKIETHKNAARMSLLINLSRFLGTRDGPFVAFADLLYVVASLLIRRHFVSKLRHRTFARVVTRQHEIDAVIEAIQQLPQVSRATGNILRGIVRASHTVTRPRARHQLHQPARTFRRDRVRVEVRLLFHHQKDQVWIDIVLVTILTDQTVEPGPASAPTACFLSGLCDRRLIFDFDTIHTRAVDED